jgi:alanyl-tRNA synthetase
VARQLKVPTQEAQKRVAALQQEIKEYEKKFQSLEAKMASSRVSSLIAAAKKKNGYQFVSGSIPGADPKVLRTMGDEIRNKLGSCVVVLGSRNEHKAHLIVMVSKDLTDRIDANAIIKAIAPTIGGQGGGRKDMASAGGKQPEHLDQALKLAESACLT